MDTGIQRSSTQRCRISSRPGTERNELSLPTNHAPVGEVRAFRSRSDVGSRLPFGWRQPTQSHDRCSTYLTCTSAAHTHYDTDLPLVQHQLVPLHSPPPAPQRPSQQTCTSPAALFSSGSFYQLLHSFRRSRCVHTIVALLLVVYPLVILRSVGSSGSAPATTSPHFCRLSSLPASCSNAPQLACRVRSSVAVELE